MASEVARKPWYLVLALLVCSGLGACGSTSGWGTIELFRGAQGDSHVADFTREDDRKAVQLSFDRMMTAMDAERPRGFPLAAAELVLGAAMFIFAAAAMTGRGGARRALVQITFAQAVLVLVAYFLTPKTRFAQLDWAVAQEAGKLLEAGQTQAQVDRTLPAVHVLYHGLWIAQLAVRSVVAALVMFALTRPRARAYYEARPEQPHES